MANVFLIEVERKAERGQAAHHNVLQRLHSAAAHELSDAGIVFAGGTPQVRLSFRRGIQRCYATLPGGQEARALRTVILVFFLLTFSTLSYARGAGGGGGARGYAGARGGTVVGTGSRVFFGNRGVFVRGYPFRNGGRSRGLYGYGYSYGGYPYGYLPSPYDYSPNYYSPPYGSVNEGDIPTSTNIPCSSDAASNDQNTGNVSHGGAVVITVGPDGYTRDGVFHSFH